MTDDLSKQLSSNLLDKIAAGKNITIDDIKNDPVKVTTIYEQADIKNIIKKESDKK